MFLLPQRNEPMSMHVFNLLQTKLYVLLVFWAVHFSGASTNHRLPSLMRIFAGNAYLYSRCTVCSSPAIFVWSYAVIFSEKWSHII